MLLCWRVAGGETLKKWQPQHEVEGNQEVCDEKVEGWYGVSSSSSSSISLLAYL